MKSFPPSQPSSRRNFLKKGILATGALSFGFPAITSCQSPNSKLNTAFIGVGGRGGGNLGGIGALTHPVALCDVDLRALNAAKQKFPNARTYRDFRELNANLENVDAVVVSSTEHTHAFAVLPGLRAGKHIYCEKPLSRDVHEARVMMEAAKKANVTTQMGTQIHATENYRRVVEAVRGGLIGDVTEVHVWVSRAWGMQSREEAQQHGDLFNGGLLDYIDKMPTESKPVPDYLDWDLWIGPAPMRPFHDIYHPGPRWYRYWDFANGTMSDLGSHWNDLPFWALDLDHPETIEAAGPPPHPEIAPATMSSTWTFASKQSPGKKISMTFYQGTLKPKLWSDKKIPQWDSGVLFVGSEGMILADYGKMTLLPEEKFKDIERPKDRIPSSPGHYEEFVQCATQGKKASCDFAYSGLLTVSNHLGGVAYRSGEKITWDPVSGKTNSAKANAFLSRTYREGWVL